MLSEYVYKISEYSGYPICLSMQSLEGSILLPIFEKQGLKENGNSGTTEADTKHLSVKL